MRVTKLLLACAVLGASVALGGAPAQAGETKAKPSGASAGGIQWFADWVQAKAEAKRTQRPILLIAAAPHCRNISGMW